MSIFLQYYLGLKLSTSLNSIRHSMTARYSHHLQASLLGKYSALVYEQGLLWRYPPVRRTGIFLKRRKHFLLYIIKEKVICVPVPLLKY